jgi:hypothetical protein
VVLIIILIALLTKGSSGDNPSPKPGPNPPIPPHNFTNGSSNPYVFDSSSSYNGEYIYSGVISIPAHKKEQALQMANLHYENKKPYLQSLEKNSAKADAPTYTVKPNSTIETGLNNPLIENIYFEFSMMNY